MSKIQKYVCIHGHYYQPPRENAWLEVVELQDSAAPFHDWNERINFECYAPNTAARILDHENDIVKIVSNYSRMSFNFGPTLLSWMEKADPQTYASILKADKKSMKLFGGHGSALAQAHGHLILPLANEKDKETQVIWGIKDFEHRFGRKPEGMWLAETATDTATLEVLAEQGLKFTVLAPRQAKSFRKAGDKNWTELSHAGVDTRRPYLCKLPSGRSIALFFYHGGVAQGVAFEGLLNNGKHFANRLLDAFDHDDSNQVVHIATDGESYGHHHKKGEMALADCLDTIHNRENYALVNYGQYLELFPPTYEVEIHENSSWSCVHGVERWRSNCGCNTGGRPDWTQNWRGPLRDTLDWLRDSILPAFEKEAAALFKDTWAARNDYIEILLDRTPERVADFLEKHTPNGIESEEDKSQLFRLMEMQRNAMLMYTSCGWFFDEVSGIETNQILQYANRAIYYAKQTTNLDLHDEFLERLTAIPSNVHENGAVSYRESVMPARVDLARVGMHFAASYLFESYPDEFDLFNYTADSEVLVKKEAGNFVLALGRTTIKSKITFSEKKFSFAVLHLGQQNIIGNISMDMSREVFDQMSSEIMESFLTPNLGKVIGSMQHYFGEEKYSIWHLFRDEKRKILKQITDQSLRAVEQSFRDIYKDNYQLMTSMINSDIPIPEAFRNAVQFVINRDFHQFFNNGSFDIRDLQQLVAEFKKWKVKLTDESSLLLAVSERIYKEVKALDTSDSSLERLSRTIKIMEEVNAMGLKPNYWRSQNLYWSALKGLRKDKWTFASEEWEEAFYKMGSLLEMKL
jgi:alpha-amylase/alpha-mannosidase (GH57 family)